MGRETVGNSVQKNILARLGRAEKELLELSARIGILESRIGPQEMEADHLSPGQLWEGLPPKPPRGRPKKMNRQTAILRRDALLSLLTDDEGQLWEELRPHLDPPKPSDQLLEAMQHIFDERIFGPRRKVPHLIDAAQHLLRNFPVFYQFVLSEKFPKKSEKMPERIANAMAGVPNASWQTSLKKLSQRQSPNEHNS